MKELLLGCGNRRTKDLYNPEVGQDWHDLTTVDFDASCNPDIVLDLNDYFWITATNDKLLQHSFDEIHAYEVLEHLGQQGDFIAFFQTFKNIWDLLTPGGKLYASTPSWNGLWAWSDPGHTRIISEGSLAFLDQANYEDQIGKTAMTDYRKFWPKPYNFKTIYTDHRDERFWFVLEKPKH